MPAEYDCADASKSDAAVRSIWKHAFVRMIAMSCLLQFLQLLYDHFK